MRLCVYVILFLLLVFQAGLCSLLLLRLRKYFIIEQGIWRLLKLALSPAKITTVNGELE
jgi:hypothetical protein